MRTLEHRRSPARRPTPRHPSPAQARARSGPFLPPVVLWAEDTGRVEPHEVEVFGPVCTVIGYRDTAHAIDLAARGRGSLVGSIVSQAAIVERATELGLRDRLLLLDPMSPSA